TGTTLDIMRKRWSLPEATLDWIVLSFYERGVLVRISSEGNQTYCVAAGGEPFENAEWFMLNETSGIIAAANKAARLKLDPVTVLDYLRFYMGYTIVDPMELANDEIL